MFEMDQLMSALFLLALLLYLIPSVFRLAEAAVVSARRHPYARSCYCNRGNGKRDVVYSLKPSRVLPTLLRRQ
jgi:hypothetical protein